MQQLRQHWYQLGGIILLICAAWLLFARPQLQTFQYMMVLNLMALLAHQFEEYQLPGGAPMVINLVVYNETKQPDRYPGNAQSIMIVNLSAWVVYLLAILLPQVTSLGVGVIFFSLFQILGHCLEMNIKLKTWYNPGMATTIMLFLPLGWYTINFVASHQLLTIGGWIAAFGVLITCIGLTIILPVQSLKNRTTKYPIDDWQVQRFHQVQKWARTKR